MAPRELESLRTTFESDQLILWIVSAAPAL